MIGNIPISLLGRHVEGKNRLAIRGAQGQMAFRGAELGNA